MWKPRGKWKSSPVEENPESLPFELTGVVMGADVAIAILRNRDTQETVHLRQGEALDAWSLEEIAPRHVVLRQDDRQVRLELFLPHPEGGGTPDPAALPRGHAAETRESANTSDEAELTNDPIPAASAPPEPAPAATKSLIFQVPSLIATGSVAGRFVLAPAAGPMLM